MIAKAILYFGHEVVLICDGQCQKAWGINNRPQIKLSDDPDDFTWKADSELGNAPEDPGTYEGDQAKPRPGHELLNKWCARECERSKMVKPCKPFLLLDFSVRIDNIPDKD